MEAAGSLFHWKPSIAPKPTASGSTHSFSSGGMDDLPFSLEDLPPEIRDKIDDIIDKNEDLDSQLEAIDELLFADRPLTRFDFGAKFDIGSESGIGSDSDSGNGIQQSSDPLSSSSASSTFSHPADHESSINPNIFGPLRRTAVPSEQYMDDFIARLIPPSTTPASNSSLSTGNGNAHIPSSQMLRSQQDFLPRSSSGNRPLRDYVDNSDASLPVPPPPLGFGAKESPDVVSNSNDEQIKVVRSGETFLVTLDVPRGPWSTPSPTPSDDRNFRVSRVLVASENSSIPSHAKPGRVLTDRKDVVPTGLAELSSLQSNNLPKSLSLSRSSSRTELYAWEDIPGYSTSPHSTIRSSRSSNSDKSISGSDVGQTKVKRPSQLSFESSRKTKMSLKKDESDAESVISTPSRYSKGMTGSTVDLRRKKWMPSTQEKGKKEALATSLSADAQFNSSDDDRSDLEGIEEERKATASDDDFSSLVQMRGKNGKPAQMVRIDHRTMKAQSMLSLYDPSSSNKEKSKGKKSNKHEPEGSSSSKKRLSALFQGKLKFNRKSKEVKLRQSLERSDPESGYNLTLDSDTDLHRSDYLHPSTAPVTPTRCNMPSPSLFPAMERTGNSNSRTRPSSTPGHIADLFRLDTRDITVEETKPPLTFTTFRGQIQPMKWHEENTPGRNRWTDRSTTETIINPGELSARSSLPVNMLRLVAPDISKSAHSNSTNDHMIKTAENSPLTNGTHSNSSPRLSVNGLPKSTAPVIMITTPPGSKVTQSRSYPAGLTSLTSTRTIADTDHSNSRGHPDFASVNNSLVSGLQTGTPISRNSNTAGHREVISNPMLSTGNVLQQNRVNKGANETFNSNEEQRVLRMTYNDAKGCDRAVADVQKMVSSLLTDRKWILSTPRSTSESSQTLYRSRKDSLAINCRRLVTDAKLMVAGATRSRQDLIDSLTTALRTLASVFECSRLVLTALPLDKRRGKLLDEVIKVGDDFLNALSSATVAAGRGQDDPAMQQLMDHTTELAHSLGRLLNTIRCLDSVST